MWSPLPCCCFHGWGQGQGCVSIQLAARLAAPGLCGCDIAGAFLHWVPAVLLGRPCCTDAPVVMAGTRRQEGFLSRRVCLLGFACVAPLMGPDSLSFVCL
eukprot:jgi/Mesvir1/6826/Mv26506-RA.1